MAIGGTRDVKLRRDLQYRKRLSGRRIGYDVGGPETLLPHRTTNSGLVVHRKVDRHRRSA